LFSFVQAKILSNQPFGAFTLEIKANEVNKKKAKVQKEPIYSKNRVKLAFVSIYFTIGSFRFVVKKHRSRQGKQHIEGAFALSEFRFTFRI
jgi:hypothetical protein